MLNLGKYKDIIATLNQITGSTHSLCKAENEKKLPNLMLKFSHSGTPETLSELKKINSSASIQQVAQLNTIFYHCFVKEVARWKFGLPLAIPQARALKLLINGNLELKDVFAQDARGGVFTGEFLRASIKEVRKKLFLLMIYIIKKFFWNIHKHFFHILSVLNNHQLLNFYQLENVFVMN